MKLKQISWRNIGPFGNKLQTITLPDEGGLWMVLGKNGNGKCLSPNTKITVNIENKIVRKKFLEFLKK